jgi:hypothetical protein
LADNTPVTRSMRSAVSSFFSRAFTSIALRIE